jgi:hypothetical protein
MPLAQLHSDARHEAVCGGGGRAHVSSSESAYGAPPKYGTAATGCASPGPSLVQGNVELRLGDFLAARDSFSQAADLAPGIAGYRLRAGQLAFEVRLRATRTQALPSSQALLACAAHATTQMAIAVSPCQTRIEPCQEGRLACFHGPPAGQGRGGRGAHRQGRAAQEPQLRGGTRHAGSHAVVAGPAGGGGGAAGSGPRPWRQVRRLGRRCRVGRWGRMGPGRLASRWRRRWAGHR